METSDFDEQVIAWLAMQDQPTVNAVAGLFRRVREAGQQSQPDVTNLVALLTATADALDPAPYGIDEFEPVLAERAASVGGVLRGMLQGILRSRAGLAVRAEAATLLLRKLIAERSLPDAFVALSPDDLAALNQ